MNVKKISIIIPAYNEGRNIAATIEQLLVDSDLVEPEIIVVCNGCTDDTVAQLGQFFSAVRCIETEYPSKTNALNLGDQAASFFPRVYLDADIRISLSDIGKLIMPLSQNGKLLAVPKMVVDTSRSSWWVKSYYDVWCDLPYCRNGTSSGGVYSMSNEGRARFSDFPNIIADDRFTRASFVPEERAYVENSISIVTAPSVLSDLIKIKTRSRMGGYEFEKLFPELLKNEQTMYGMAASELIGQLRLWPKIAVYILINIITRIRSRLKMNNLSSTAWERDESSRQNMTSDQ